ncbi:hypothetical protein PRIPAC_78269 [Pristionchus pacificus]|uniref:Uncharacterized protein n=1 Tax=Pristionchus pacificus TaxID=54126 RepID=A0A2A6BI83_PRIPA|nr:hypothetical protein PRIPAC_78269 [Pristionchus pacificus]|eukprot:PDM65599.1 hypothetical protein PRIPAC_52541 [Pristionchus pacificus]
MMSLNRLTLILFPTHSIFYDKGFIQCLMSIFVWTISVLGNISFFIGRCKRQMLLDGTFVDSCPITREGLLGNSEYLDQYFQNPILYDVAQFVREVIIRCYDILPLLSFCIYAIITILLIARKKFEREKVYVIGELQNCTLCKEKE